MPHSNHHRRNRSGRHVSGHPARRQAPAVAESLLEMFGEALAQPDPYACELNASSILGVLWEGSEFSRTEIVEEFIDMVLNDRRVIERHPVGAVLLASLAAVAPPSRQDALREVLQSKLATSPQPWQLPSWFDLIGRAELTGGICLTDVYGDQHNFLMAFSYPGFPSGDHLVVGLVDHNLHLIKDMFSRPASLRELEDFDLAADDAMVKLDFDPQQASDLLNPALEITDMTIGEPFGEESASARMLLGARMSLLPAPAATTVAEVTDSERTTIVNAFMRTKAVEALTQPTSGDTITRDSVRFVTRCLIDYACDYGAGDPLRWSPIAAEIFLTDWAVRKVMWQPEDVIAVPDVMTEFVAYACKRKKLANRWVLETQATIDRFAGDFLMSVLDGSQRGPSLELVESMLADGVDLESPEQIQQWIDRYNQSLGLMDGPG